MNGIDGKILVLRGRWVVLDCDVADGGAYVN